MFLLVAGTPAELQSLEQHFKQAGVLPLHIRGLTYEGLAELPGDDVPNHNVIVVAMSVSVTGWQAIASRLKGLAPQSYLTCAFLGNPPHDHVPLLTKKVQEIGASLIIITDANPTRTRGAIDKLKKFVPA